tara:strand:+ start:201 stop:500 length:300 start_codon:yes stop_codon:yes gene_type:complete
MSKKTNDPDKIRVNYIEFQKGILGLSEELNKRISYLFDPSNIKRKDFEDVFEDLYADIDETLDEIKSFSNLFFTEYKHLDLIAKTSSDAKQSPPKLKLV